MIRSMERESSGVSSAVIFTIARLACCLLRESSHCSQDIELHQLVERDRRVEVFARQPQRLMQGLEDHLHPERELELARRLHVFLCSLRQLRHTVQLGE